MKILTVKELKESLKNVSDDLEVRLLSDTGLDQPRFDGNDVVLLEAREIYYKLPDEEKFEDGSNEIHYFAIYGNEIPIEELKGSNDSSFEEMVGFVENVCKDIKSQPTLHEELEEERKTIAKIVGDFKEVNK